MDDDFLPYSLNIEKHCLAAMLKHPELINDFLPFIKTGAFYNEVHEIIFESIKSLYSTEATVDRVVLIQRINNLGITHKDNVNVGDYIQALFSLHGVNVKSVPKYFQELNKYHIARKVCLRCDELSKDIKNNLNLSVSEIISKAHVGIADCVTSHIEEDFNPREIFIEAEGYIENIGNEPQEDGIPLPFPIISRLYGNLLAGDLTVVAAPAGQGKSTFLNCIARYAVENKYAKVLFLDTEMETERVIRRSVAAESGVSEYYLRTGKWRNSQEMVEKVRGLWDKYRNWDGFEHMYSANKPIDEILSIVRRWSSKMKALHGSDVKLLVIYDYLKLTGEKPSDSWKGYQIMGAKCDALKHMCSEIGASGLAAIQTNASGNIAMSQEIRWFSSNIYILTPKSPELMTTHGQEFGTHTLRADKTRNQGEEAEGFRQFVQIRQQDGSVRYEPNFINLNFDNFAIEERGTYQDIISRSAGNIDLEEETFDDRDLL
jgi:replicative DNA helicase